MGFLLGLCAFALFFLSDYNDWRLKRRELKLCFPLGGVLLLAATLLRCGSPAAAGWLRAAAVLAAVGFLVLLVYTLFFAIPLEASYAHPGEKRSVCTVGVYALCRHPGVLWFIGLYGCLIPAAGFPLTDAAAYCVLNILLVWFEDRHVFPELLEGYGDYRRSVPFLIPTVASVRAALRGKKI